MEPLDVTSIPQSASPQAFTHFETMTPTTYELPLDLQSAAQSYGERVESWLGPVNSVSGSRRSFTSEVDRDGINTLLSRISRSLG
jgi:hypothetical protein